jgi:ferredoxin-type protein NapF
VTDKANRNISRLEFLRGSWRGGNAPMRPPWALAEPLFLDSCDGCGACIDACTEKLLTQGRGRYPRVDFSRGECTFCQRCVDACRTDALAVQADQPAWDLQAGISQECLAMRGVVCRSCAESCEQCAIVFRLALGGVSRPQLQSQLCNGCGACIKPCPVGAITMRHGEQAAAQTSSSITGSAV